MTCNCESTKCLHEPARCQEIATVKVQYIGGACLDCAITLRDYVLPL